MTQTTSRGPTPPLRTCTGSAASEQTSTIASLGPGGAPHDNVIEGGRFYQDERTPNGGSLAIRGANNITATPNAGGSPPRFGNPASTATENRDAVLILEKLDKQTIEADAHDILLGGAILYHNGIDTPANVVSAVFIGPGAFNIDITNTTVNYPGCDYNAAGDDAYGVWTQDGVATPDVTTDAFVPNEPCNTN